MTEEGIESVPDVKDVDNQLRMKAPGMYAKESTVRAGARDRSGHAREAETQGAQPARQSADGDATRRRWTATRLDRPFSSDFSPVFRGFFHGRWHVLCLKDCELDIAPGRRRLQRIPQ
jgi:hypothetical protein